MSKRNRPTTAAQATHRRRRHAYRSAYNSPEGKAARGIAVAKPADAAKKPAPAAAKKSAAPAAAKPAATKPPAQS